MGGGKEWVLITGERGRGFNRSGMYGGGGGGGVKGGGVEGGGGGGGL